MTLLAPYEQYDPVDYPGVRTGDAPQAMALFDLSTDASEQHNVADANPDVVKRLKAQFDEVAKDFPKLTESRPNQKKNRKNPEN